MLPLLVGLPTEPADIEPDADEARKQQREQLGDRIAGALAGMGQRIEDSAVGSELAATLQEMHDSVAQQADETIDAKIRASVGTTATFIRGAAFAAVLILVAAVVVLLVVAVVLALT